MRKKFLLHGQVNELAQQLEQKVVERTQELALEKKKSERALIDGQELERKRIAQDLHDELGIKIINVKHLTEILALKYFKNDVTDNLQSQIEDIYASLRHISKNMYSYPLQKLGLVPAIQDLCDTITKHNTSLNCQTYFDNNLPPLPEIINIYLYRIVQELLTNMTKHAHASQFQITIKHSNKTIHLEIKDNGVGFDLSKQVLGLGLKSVQSRVALLNGSFSMQTQENEGCVICIFFNI